jgi:hypothetical protein
MSFVTPTPKKHKPEASELNVPSLPAASSDEGVGYSRKNKSLGVLAENFIAMFQT